MLVLLVKWIPFLEIAQRHNLHVDEDAAQGIMASYNGRRLGGLGCLGALSFHKAKNLISGEGALFWSTILHLLRVRRLLERQVQMGAVFLVVRLKNTHFKKLVLRSTW